MVRYESLVGSGDLSDDLTAFPTFWTDTSDSTSGVTDAAFFGTGPAIKSTQYGLTTHMMIPINAGRHTVALAARNLSTTSDTVSQSVTQVEIVAIEMWD